MRLIDAHCHLASPDYADVDGLISRAKKSGVVGLVASGTSYENSRQVLELSRTHKGFVFPTVGTHPERRDLSRKEVEETKKLIREARGEIIGIGEVGIPFYSVRGTPDAPGRMEAASLVLAEFASLARSTKLAIVVHAPHEAASYALKALREEKVVRALFHWHKASDHVTRAIVEMGYHVSVTPEICYEERDRRLAKSVPISNLVVETDGPWRYEGAFGGAIAEPTMLKSVIREVARVRNEPLRRVSEQLVQNTIELFGIKL